MRELSAYIAGAGKRRLPKVVEQAAKLEVVDTFAAMVSGSRLIPGLKALEFARSQPGKREAVVVGSTIVTSALAAALANGMLAHADETDSGHSPSLSHISASAVPVALALCERDGLGGSALLRALVLGFDVGTRILLAIGSARLLKAGHHAPAIGQLFAAAATACCLLNLSARQVRYALAYTAEQTAGLCTMFRDPEHIEKAFAMGGMPAHNGLRAALMAAHGFTGVEDCFSGEQDFFFTFSHGGPTDRDAIARSLGSEYEILRSSIKRWPVGGPIQGPLNVVRDLMDKHGITAAEVAEITARVPEAEASIVDDRDMPEISLQQMVATMLVDGTVTFASAHDYKRMRDRRMVALRKKIRVIGDPVFGDHPRAWCCIVEITLNDGRRLRGETFASKGSYRNPLTPDEEEEKALDLMNPVLGKAKTRKLLENLWQLEEVPDMKQLRKFAVA